MSKSLPQLTAKTDSEDSDIYHMVRNNVDYKQTYDTLFDPLRYAENVPAYSGATTYEAANPPSVRYVLYNDIVWEYIGASPSSGTTPGTDATKWQKVFAGQLGHFKDEDVALALGSADEVTAADLRAHLDGWKTAELDLSNADLKSLTTSVGIEVIPAPAAGYFIEVLSASIKYTYATAGFDQAISPVLKTVTASAEQMESNINFTTAANRFCRFRVTQSTNTQVVDAQAVKIYSSTTQATTGGGTAKLYVSYRVVAL